MRIILQKGNFLGHEGSQDFRLSVFCILGTQQFPNIAINKPMKLCNALFI